VILFTLFHFQFVLFESVISPAIDSVVTTKISASREMKNPVTFNYSTTVVYPVNFPLYCSVIEASSDPVTVQKRAVNELPNIRPFGLILKMSGYQVIIEPKLDGY